MSVLSSEFYVEFPEDFRDGNLFQELLQAGFKRSESIPGTIVQGSQGWMKQGLKNKVEASMGHALPVLKDRLSIPPSTRAEPVEDQSSDDPETMLPNYAEPVEVEELPEDAEPLELDHLDMTPAALALAQENNIHPVELLDRYGEDHRIIKADVQALLE